MHISTSKTDAPIDFGPYMEQWQKKHSFTDDQRAHYEEIWQSIVQNGNPNRRAVRVG